MPLEPKRIESVFHQALAKSDPAERAAFVEEAGRADAELGERVQRLLAAHAELEAVSGSAHPGSATATFTPANGHGPAPTRQVIDSAVAIGTVIAGRYKLLQEIGEGGMGVVYMAEQEQPVRRRVALKIIKPGMDSGQVVARFEAERQALAMMDHQNIARVLDAGTTEEKEEGGRMKDEQAAANRSDSSFILHPSSFRGSRPFFVMELVHGIPITKFCDENRLTPRERLELFVPVCQAIQHAHQKGIIHRDVKPSNVLVTLYDDKPVPKVIDFGVAKAVEQRLTERTMFTQFGTMVGTFEYMSPEQAAMNAFGVDTRSDIYSLGVLLYELLTGTTPLSRKRLKEAAFDELLRLIKEEEPPKPSTRLSTSEALVSVAAARKTEPAKLSRLMRGEVDWIVMKCLEKDRTRRYETANGLARDVQRYLADEPVEACPPSVRYKLRKFVRRNKGPVATGAILLLTLLGGIFGTTWGLIEARQQRDAAEAARDDVLEAWKEAGVRTGIAIGIRMRLSEQLADAKALLGANLLAQHNWVEAEPILRECIAIRQEVYTDDWETFNAQSWLGGALAGQKKYAEAEPLLLQGYEGLKQREAKIPADSKVRLTEALERLVQFYEATDKPHEAAKWRKELELARASAKAPVQP